MAAECPGSVAALALRPKEAAKALGISERLLWTWTNQGVIPHLRIGKAVVYPVDSLRAWLIEQAQKGGN
jgi:excisionase family DNA binding protein